MGRVNIVKQIKVDGKWTLRSIPKKESGHYDWAALPDGDYFVEWREDGRRGRPRVLHPYPRVRFDASKSPHAVTPHVGICAGGVG
jgi:hypothetical protein